MSKLLSIILLFTLFRCSNGASEAEEAHIKQRIYLHNNASLTYIVDSLNKRTELNALVLYQGNSQERAEVISDSLMRIVYTDRNLPYNPEFDHNLSYEKFIAYCREKGLDPVKTANKLSVK